MHGDESLIGSPPSAVHRIDASPNAVPGQTISCILNRSIYGYLGAVEAGPYGSLRRKICVSTRDVTMFL